MKTKILSYVFALLLLLNTGCSTEFQPLGNANGEQIWGTATGSEQMLAGAYSRLRKILIYDRPMYLYGDLPAQGVLYHNHWIKKQAYDGNYVGSYIQSSDWLDWTAYYQVIATTTTLLKHINDVPINQFAKDENDAVKKRNHLRGEAYFLYAYAYFHMVRIHGDVPLVKEAFESSSQGIEEGSTIPRTQAPEKEILEYLIENINAAIVLMDYKKHGDADWAIRVDKAAALTLKAHVLLWLARDLDPSSQEAVKYASDAEAALDIVINQSGRSLVNYDNPTDVVNMFDGQSTEGIFELHVAVKDNESFRINYGENALHCTTYRDVSKKEEENLNNYMVVDPSKGAEYYPATDKRRTLFYQNFGNAMQEKAAPPFLMKYAAHIEDDPSNSEYYLANSNVLVFRLSECILLRAEALNKLGRTGNARTMLNQIRQRAGIGNFMGSDSELKKAIFDERMRELAGEGHSAYDRIRNDYWEGHTFMDAQRKAQKGYYWPMDMQALISANPGLYQVPFWIGKL